MPKLSTKKEASEEGTVEVEVVQEEAVEGVLVEAEPSDVGEVGFEDGPDEQVELDDRHRVREDKLVPVRPRRTVMHTHIGGVWYNFIEGREVMVPPPVRDWLYEKKVL